MSRSDLDAYLANLVDVVEGPEYTNNPNDRGGPTKYGITQKTLARYLRKPVSPAMVEAMSRDTALAIYWQEYIELPGFDKLAEVSSPVALECIDTGVNMGVQVATVLLQRCLNTLRAALKVDGSCGPKTVEAVRNVIKQRGPEGVRILLLMLNCEQGARYIAIAEADPSQTAFVFGWFRQRIQMVPDAKFYGALAWTLRDQKLYEAVA